MFRPLSLFIGLRYTRAKRRNHFISFISLVSMIGIALGMTALITILSVMNGFENELRHRILGMTSHATVSGYGESLDEWSLLQKNAESHERIVASAPFIRKEVMLIRGQQVNGSLLRGILPEEEPRVSEVANKMAIGRLDELTAGTFRIVLGIDLARKLGVMVGDKVTVVTPTANVSITGMVPRLKRFTVSGIFDAGMYEYDSALALVHLADAQRLFRMGEGVTGLRLKLDDLFEAPRVSRELARSLPGIYLVRDWTQQHANFFRALKIEKRMMFFVVLLVVAVAAFNIISAMMMTVTDKESDIAILRTLGASPRDISRIFLVQGTIIGLAGASLGLLGGLSLALNVEAVVPFIEQSFGIEFMPADVYYISDLPSDVELIDVIEVSVYSFLLSVGATLYPAWRASRTQPAEALRYE